LSLHRALCSMADWESHAKVVSTKAEAFWVLFLAWLVPGAGHLWLGRRKKASLLAPIIVVTFLLGIILHGKLYRFEPGLSGSETLINFLTSIGGIGGGLLFFIATGLGAATGDLASPTYEIGVTFLLAAGLLNFLVAFDAYRCAVGYDYDAAEMARRLAKEQRRSKRAKKAAKAESTR